MKIESKQLAAIEIIRREGGLTQAAIVLGTSQPALSRLVNDIEIRLDAPIFDRSHRPWKLTELGKALSVQGASVISAQFRAESEISRFHTGSLGNIRLIGPPFFTDGVISSLLPAFRTRHSGVSFEVRYGYADELRNAVRFGQVDMAFYPLGIGALDEDLEFTNLLEARNVIVCRKDHPILRLAYPRPLALLDYEWIVPPVGSPLAADMEAVLSDLEMQEARIAFAGGSLGGVMNFLQASDCLTVMPESTATIFGRHFGIQIVPIKTNTPKRSLGILTRSKRELNHVCRTFVDHLKEVFAGGQFQETKAI